MITKEKEMSRKIKIRKSKIFVSNSNKVLTYLLQEYSGILSLIAAVGITMTIIPLLVRFVKWLTPPKISVKYADYSDGKVNPSNPDEIVVSPNRPIKIGFDIRPIWSYKPTIIEILGHKNSTITRAEIFVKGLRPWEKPYPSPDIHGDYKLLVENYLLKKDSISEPTLIDVEIKPPLKTGEKRKITVRVDTEESRKLFVKDFWITAK